MAAPKDFDFKDEEKDTVSEDTDTQVKDSEEPVTTEEPAEDDGPKINGGDEENTEDKTEELKDDSDSEIETEEKETEVTEEDSKEETVDEVQESEKEEKSEEQEETVVEEEEKTEEEPKEDMNPDQNQPAQNQAPFGISDSKSSGNGAKPFIIGGVLTLILLVAGGGYFFYKSQSEITEDVGETLGVTEEVGEAPEPSPVPEVAEIDRSEWTLEVLNGSGVAGAAAKAKTALEAKGYKVSKTGNADSSDYETTEILVSSDMSEKADALLADLKDEFSVTKAGDFDSTTVSARIIIGTDWADSASDTSEEESE